MNERISLPYESTVRSRALIHDSRMVIGSGGRGGEVFVIQLPSQLLSTGLPPRAICPEPTRRAAVLPPRSNIILVEASQLPPYYINYQQNLTFVICTIKN